MTTGHTDDEDRADRAAQPALPDLEQVDHLVGEYLRELEREAARLQWNTRQELLEDVRSHIDVAIAESDAAELDGDRIARARQILSALGEPREIVDAAAADDPPLPPPNTNAFPPPPHHGLPFTNYGPPYQYPTDPGPPPYPLGTQEVLALGLLLVGGFLFVVGWFVGVGLLWTSSRWKLRERLIGTFLFPGGVVGVLMFGGMSSSARSCAASSADHVEHCTTDGWSFPVWLGVPLFFLCLAVPFVTAFYLAKRARSRPAAHPGMRRSGVGTVVTAVGGVVLFFLLGGAFFACSVAGGGGKVSPAAPAPSPSGSYSWPTPPSPVSSTAVAPVSSPSP